MSSARSESVDRPALWVGHVVLASHNLRRSFEFYRSLGLRGLHPPAHGDGIVELEMRGGTHLVLVLDPGAPTDGRGAPFDLMADDLDELHATLRASGADPSPIARDGHDSFVFHDPDGYLVTVNDSHVQGPV
jgi:catechol 2,3-dioxygenase-like lactoylglutathione lyase family enzyme